MSILLITAFVCMNEGMNKPELTSSFTSICEGDNGRGVGGVGGGGIRRSEVRI